MTAITRTPQDKIEHGARTPDDQSVERYALTDSGNAERFAHQHGEVVRYCQPFRRWYVWDGARWRLDDRGRVELYAKETARAIYGEAEKEPSEADRKAIAKWAQASEAAGKRRGMVLLAQCEPPIPISPGELDRDRWLLNCPNGTLDLRTGELREHRPEDFITKLCPVQYDAKALCPAWLDFLLRIFAERCELIDFVQRLVGYCLTGNVSEQVLPIFYGVGANGKSTLINAMFDCLGPDYAMKAAPELLLMKRGDAHPTERADLFGKRFVAAVESDDGRRLAESLVKELSGGDRVRARHMRQDFWEYDPTHKIVLATNHKPTVRGTDHAMWRRLRLVPFDVVIADADQDKHLADKLRSELSGILAWAVRGCLWWQREGLGSAEAIDLATKEYRDEQDTVGDFLAQCCVVGEGRKVRASDVYRAYKDFAGDAGETALPQKLFGPKLADRGFVRRTSNGTWYHGLGLLTSAPQSLQTSA